MRNIVSDRIAYHYFRNNVSKEFSQVLFDRMNVDPLAEKYPSVSPYVYVVNNPIFWTDPTGVTIELGSQKEWDKQTASVEKQRDKLQAKIDKTTAKADAKGWSADKLAGKLGNLNDRVSSLNNTISTF